MPFLTALCICLINDNVADVIAKLSHNNSRTVRAGCTLCGFPGHFRYQCRNFQQINPNQNVMLDVSSTSSDSDLEEEEALNHYLIPRKEE